MSGNASFRLSNTAILSVVGVEAPLAVPSTQLDEQLAETLGRIGIRPGLLERLAGVKERRWWPDEVSIADAAAMAGAKALAEAGIQPEQVGVMINASVTRDFVEPAISVDVHYQLGLPRRCLNFDVTNACLAFVNSIQLIGAMIDSGQTDYALIVDGEVMNGLQQRTLERLSQPDVTLADFKEQFATLTLGSGAAAMVLGRADRHPEGHRVIGGVSRAGTEHHELCVADMTRMRTDSSKLFEHGIALLGDAWRESTDDFGWGHESIDWYVGHQASKEHIRTVVNMLGERDLSKSPSTIELYGNLGPAALPFTLAMHQDRFRPSDRMLLVGIGSGLNASILEVIW